MEVSLPRKDVCDASCEIAEAQLRALRLVAKGLGTNGGTLRRWMAFDAVDFDHVEGLTIAAKRSLVELRRKTRVLVVENEIPARALA